MSWNISAALKIKPPEQMTDDELIRACRQGNEAAWETVLDKYERLVYSIPLNHGLTREDAADIAQLTFTILLQSLDALQPDSHLGPWLATVARRHTWRLLERRRRKSVGHEDDLADSMVLPDESDRHGREQAELAEWLLQGLARIGQRCRDLLSALYFDDKQPSYAEIALDLGVREGSIGPTRARCLARLREFLED
ncbi:MAG TPA: sigma-70 family RNA polymerase sigma factor [Anaerolineae bacterium]|nr:sigma-70 family RNA polymerase sigma factor [Anaerolineae bacterium]